MIANVSPVNSICKFESNQQLIPATIAKNTKQNKSVYINMCINCKLMITKCVASKLNLQLSNCQLMSKPHLWLSTQH